jgi:hypothetical protein
VASYFGNASFLARPAAILNVLRLGRRQSVLSAASLSHPQDQDNADKEVPGGMPTGLGDVLQTEKHKLLTQMTRHQVAESRHFNKEEIQSHDNHNR